MMRSVSMRAVKWRATFRLPKSYAWRILPRFRTYATESAPFDTETDVLIVGTGAAGLTAALRAHSHGLKTLVVEKGSKIGGASAYSGGGLWIPNNHVSRAAGSPDNQEDALRYMESVIAEGAPQSTRERKIAFLENAPQMVQFLEDLGFKWMASIGYSDYHADHPGASVKGRSIEGDLFNLKKLGDWKELVLMNPAIATPMPFHTNEISSLVRSFTSMGTMLKTIRLVLSRALGRRMLGQIPAALGTSLIAQLLYLNKKIDSQIWRNSPLVEIITKEDKGAVLGAVISKDGKPTRVRARKGVLLAAGGFAKNKKMREQYGPAPASIEWTSVPPGDMGDAIVAGMKIGAATTMMDDAWWGPTLMVNSAPLFEFAARSLPHSIIVDSSGSRFMNESESYVDAGHHQYERHKKVKAVPAWMIIDSNHRNKYLLGNLMPRMTPKSAFDSGFLTKGDTIKELADRIGVDKGLSETVARFNDMARKGVDEDFGRGSTAYDHVYSDPLHKPNPNMGPIERGPFYAAQIYPGDLGTKGGLVTDEHARVLCEDGSSIPGLYAAGNTTASVMGRRYPGPGSTLGPATTFAYIAMNHIASA